MPLVRHRDRAAATLPRVLRIRLIAVVAGVAAFAALLAPGVAAAAGTLTWNLASDFTSNGSGANPDHDQYGTTPWTYVEGPVSAGLFGHDPSAFAPLPQFGTGVRGGLAGWSDPSDPSGFIGINPTGAAIAQPPVSYPAHAIAVQPPADRLVAVGWTSPFSEAVSVAVSGTVSADDADPTCLVAGPQWSLDQNGSQLLTGTTVSPVGSVSDPAVTVQPGGTIYLTVTPGASANCSNVAVSLTIQAPASAPAVTLVSPAHGAVISGGQPTFSGAASTDAGDVQRVTVRVYQGSSTSGSPLETLTTAVSGGGYAVRPTTPLADGTYTAQAEQADVLSPPLVGLSAATTFTVANSGPKVTLTSSSKPSRTGTPTLKGTAGTGAGDAGMVAIAVYAGTGENGSPLRFKIATVKSSGAFSAKITPALSDGIYTAAAAQNGSDGTGISQPMTFEIKAKPPSVSLIAPATGASVASALPIFTGTAGTSPGDSSTVTVTLYKGASAHRKPIGKVKATTIGGQWLALWPHQLPLGLYTAQASQSDNAGHTSLSAVHRFLIVPGSKVIGRTVTLAASGTVSAPITCLAPPGMTCAGDVLIVTAGKFQPASGGPLGRLRLLFEFVQVPGGHTVSVHSKVSRAVARILHRSAPLKVDVTLALKTDGRVIAKLSGTATLRVR
jgi:hypothetical protein